MSKIVECTIEPGETAALFASLGGVADPQAVKVVFEDGVVMELFEFYSDELHFTRDEFIGLTADEARQLHFTRDVAYLRS